MTSNIIPIQFVLEGIGIARGELKRFLSPLTGERIVKALPLSGRISRWKEEIYFEIPLKMGPEKPKTEVEVGTIAYWPMGSAICIFYGNTKPYSPVNLIGNINDNLKIFKEASNGTAITMQKET